MTRKLLLVFVLLLAIKTIAQDKKWSVEANYSIIPAEGFGGDDDIFELGIKYRFADFGFLELGLGSNFGFSREKFDHPTTRIKTDRYYFQPRIFSEFRIPGVEKLRPSLGLGYSIVNTDFENNLINSNNPDGGFNFNLGVSYDIFERFFVQVQYDFINLNVDNDLIIDGEVIQVKNVERLNNLKIGIGFRF